IKPSLFAKETSCNHANPLPKHARTKAYRILSWHVRGGVALHERTWSSIVISVDVPIPPSLESQVATGGGDCGAADPAAHRGLRSFCQALSFRAPWRWLAESGFPGCVSQARRDVHSQATARF